MNGAINTDSKSVYIQALVCTLADKPQHLESTGVSGFSSEGRVIEYYMMWIGVFSPQKHPRVFCSS